MIREADSYDGVLQWPFLAEHWYKGFVAAAITFFLIWLAGISFFINSNDCLTCFNTLNVLIIGISGMAGLAVLAAAVLQHQKFELNSTLSKYRICTWVLGLRFGRWQTLPAISRITIRPYNKEYFLPLADDSTPPGYNGGIVSTEHKWQVLLHNAQSPVGIIAAYVGYPKALKSATLLGEILNVPVTVEKGWI